MPKSPDQFTIDAIAASVRYEPETGRLYWLPRAPETFIGSDGQTKAHTANLWNARFAGKEAFTCARPDGYLTSSFNNRKLLAHRVAWLLGTGAWPKGAIDHINGNPADNRLSNLRDVPSGENQKNMKMFRNNTSGVAGVHRKGGRWVAEINSDSCRHYLGCFKSKAEAAEARLAAQRRLGFSDRHGTA